jgi:capsular polysaccharide biosynthesis protein
VTESNQRTEFLEEETIDLREYLNVIKKWRKFIALGTLFCILTSMILSFFVLPPVYEATTLLLATQATDKPQIVQAQDDGLDGVVNTVSRLPIMTMNTYLGQVKSGIVLQRVIEGLKLDPNLYTPDSLSDMITADIVKDSNLIEIKVQNNDPRLSANIANTLCKEYLQMISEKNQEQMTRSMSFLEQQRKSNDEKLRAAMEALRKFQEQPRGVAVLEQEFSKKATDLASFESQLEMASVEIKQLNAAVERGEQELSSTPQTIATTKLDPQSGKLVSGQDINPIYIDISQRLNQKKADLAEKQAEIDGLQIVVNSSQQKLSQLQAELAGKKLREDQLQGEMDRLKETSSTLAQKATETQISKSIDLGDTSIIVVSRAAAPTVSIKPNKKLNIAVALVLGLIIFTLLAFILERLDNTLKTPDDVSRYLELPVIGIIPEDTVSTD